MFGNLNFSQEKAKGVDECLVLSTFQRREASIEIGCPGFSLRKTQEGRRRWWVEDTVTLITRWCMLMLRKMTVL